MIEELTPAILTLSLLLIGASAPILTLLLSTLLLWRYRRSVTRAMAAAGEFRAVASPSEGSSPGRHRALDAPAGRTLYRMVRDAPRLGAIRYAAAGLAFALVFALAARFVYPVRLDAAGFLIAVWIYAWPVVLGLPLVIPGPMRRWAVSVAAYFAAFLVLALWAASVPDFPELQFGGIELSARSTVTPSVMMRAWLVVNGPPTLLVLLCLDRRVRAVAPLVLTLVTTAITGTWAVSLALVSGRGAKIAVQASVSLGMPVRGLVLAIVVLALASSTALGWAMARGVARAYRRRKVSDQSLLLDALWLVFANAYTMWLVLGGLAWAAVAPVAFVAFKLALALTRRVRNVTLRAARGLTFLRVFSLGRRSDALLDTVARYWRYIGSVQVITGPDVALTTVQPHQFLDFLSGKLGRHFVRDSTSLERRLAEQDRNPDPDGRFRINNFFCHADSWQPALPRLVEEGDTVLMDLRSFSASNVGCIHELWHLTQHVPFDRCLLIVDNTTDGPFLRRTLEDAWAHLSPESPNVRLSPAEAPLHRLEGGPAAVRLLLSRLCEAATTSDSPRVLAGTGQ